METLEVISDSSAATTALDPMRSRLLAELREPMSAAALSNRVGLSRQKVNYHLRQLERHGLVRLAETRRWGGLTERMLVASASGYLVSPEAMGEAAGDPVSTADRLSAGYVVALAARLVRELGGMLRNASRRHQRLPAFGLDSAICFRSPSERAAFTEDLTRAITRVIAEYHDPQAPDGRWHRLLVASHPVPKGVDPTPSPKETT
jgi:DNA-binding transcriptional ArsR family regulator